MSVPINMNNDFLEAIENHGEKGGKFLFWTCPNKCDGLVEWQLVDDIYVAKCKVCGELPTNEFVGFLLL